jgi:DNA-binding transcriptional regulator YiaG
MSTANIKGGKPQKAKRGQSGPKKPKTTQMGREILQALQEAVEMVRSGEPPEKNHRVTRMEIDLEPKAYTPDDVKRIRKLVTANQAIFARLLGVETNTVSQWEQGVRVPMPLACRFMEEIELNPAYFQKRIKKATRFVRIGPTE